MPDAVIKVQGLGKKYKIRLGGQKPSRTLREALPKALRSLLHPFKSAGAGSEDFWALKDVSFEVKRGECVGIIGRNGAGKSTLLKILSRITEPTTGRIELHGRVGSLLEVGTGFHAELTGRENIYLNGTILGMKKKEIDRRFDEIVAFSEIEKFLDTPVKRYSSGMYVRLAFAVAAHLEPEILIVDEVLAVGDVAFQKKCLGKMGDVAKGGRTVLFVSHNMAAVQQLCARGIVLANGQLIFSGTANDAVDQYIDMTDRRMEYGEDGFVDLEKSRDKLYQAKVFKRIRMLDENNIPRQTFPMLSAIKIEVDLENNENYPGMDYGMGILTATGQRITSFATWMLKDKKEIPKRIVLEIPRMNFCSGSFRIYLSMTHPKEGTYIDKIENAISFHIEAVDVFNTGRTFDVDYGLVVPDGNFMLL